MPTPADVGTDCTDSTGRHRARHRGLARLARWDALDDGATVVDLVPTYAFHAHVDGGATYDIVVLALEPSAVTFVKPAPTPEPLSAESNGMTSGVDRSRLAPVASASSKLAPWRSPCSTTSATSSSA